MCCCARGRCRAAQGWIPSGVMSDTSPQAGHVLPPEHLHQRAGRVCVALAGETMFAQAEAVAATHRFFEFRLDSLPQPAQALPQLRGVLARHPGMVAVATCRRVAHGGAFRGSAEEQLHILTAAAEAGCALVDAEVETAEELGRPVLDTLRRSGAGVVLSWHDFNGTPELEPVYERLSAFRPDYLKIVPFAQSLTDSLHLIDLLERHSADGRLVAMSMGQKGVFTRVLGPRFGSAFTFAAPDGAEGTAPGQIALSTLRDLYRIDRITPATTVYAVAGNPIGASLSPRMHNTAFAAAGLDAVYLPLETADPQELQRVADRLSIRGLSITMPLKEAILPLLTARSLAVGQMGACNTLLRQPNGTWYGDNTDVAGIVDPLEQHTTLQGKRVLVLGAGGAARAAVFGLRAKGAKVFLLNRTRGRAEALAAVADAQVQPRETLAAAYFDIVINSTPYGMRGKEIAPPITADEMQCDLFFDLVYNPLETPLLRQAQQRGIPVIVGVAMFVEQGVRQFQLWTEQSAPREAMTEAVRSALA